MENQKTIFITAFFGLIARNILATDFLELIKKNKGLRIVILAPAQKKDCYREEFGGDNVIVEGIMPSTTSRLGKIIEVVFHNLSDTAAWRIHRLINVKRDKKYFSAPFLWLLSKLGYLSFIRRGARWLDYNLSDKNHFQEYFKKYQPQLVFSTDVFEPNDVDLLRGAISRKIYTIGMVRSWDNITTKGLNRIIPDKLVVNTEPIKKEAALFNDVKPENIFIVGIPHYDNYILGSMVSREELFNKLNLNPNKKTVFFAPPADLYVGANTISIKILELLNSMNAQIIIRSPVVGGVNLGRFGQGVPNKMAIDSPASAKDFFGANISKTADRHLMDLLYYADVVVAFASTLAIDAIVFDKPVVFIGFDGEPHSYWDSLARYYDYDHQRAILKTGGVRLARSPSELEEMINNYLINPQLDEMGRKKIVAERCWKLDGRSGERLADVVLSALNSQNTR